MSIPALTQVLRRISGGAFAVTFWDGTSERFGDGPPSFHITFHKPLSMTSLLHSPELVLGEAYMDGSLEVDGDLSEVLGLLRSQQHVLQDLREASFWRRGGGALASLAGRILSFIGRHLPGTDYWRLARQKRDVQAHYDIGNDFFGLWLDESMSYSCAYFESVDDDLGKAQSQKIDHVLRKLYLRPGERLLDVGSGWGGLIIRAAQQYGVRATGITLSQEQVEKTRARIQALNLEDQVDVHLLDYRRVPDGFEPYDKIASVGMFEHVGKENLQLFMDIMGRLLQPQGLMLLHTITGPVERSINPWIAKYIFPGGYIPSLREVIWQLPEREFHVLDVESLRMHYAYTLDRWARGFERHVDEIRQMYGERFVRMWHLYLLSCAQSFRTTGLNVYQILFSKGLHNELPLTRRSLYQGSRVAATGTGA